MNKDEMIEEMTEELARLRRFVGAWQTVDGVWVWGPSKVFYVSSCIPHLVLDYPAEDIVPDNRRFYASSFQAAEMFRDLRAQ